MRLSVQIIIIAAAVLFVLVLGVPRMMADQVGLYRLDSNMNDSSGNNNNGTLAFLSAPYAAFQPGVSGDALLGAGGAYVVVPDSPSLSALGSITLAAWIYLEAYPSGSLPGVYIVEAPIIRKWGPGHNEDDEYRLVVTEEQKLLASFSDQTGADVGITSIAIVPLDRWVHVAAVLDPGAAEARLYMNGVLDVSLGTTLIADFDSGFPVQIGLAEHQGIGPMAFAGLLDEIGIWNEPLGSDEIRSLASTHAVPEPATLTMLGSGMLVGLAGAAFRRSRRSPA